MEQNTLTIVLEIALVVVGGIGTYALYRLGQLESDLKQARDKALQAPDEEKVRRIVSEEIKSVEKSVDEIKKDMNQMAQNLLKSINGLENRFNELMMHMLNNKRD